MAGVSVGGGGNSHGRRSVDSEINMIPMIDLLMVTVSFLLITAVWTHMSRLEGTTRVPSQQDSNKPEEIVARMHVEVPDGDQPIRLSMQRGAETLDQTTIERNDTKSIGKKIDAMQHAHPVDLASDMSHVVVLHVGNEMRYGEMVAVMDSIAQVPDPRTRHGEPNFHVNLATK